jgi:hypothetical protein
LSGQHGVPQPTLDLHLGPRFTRMRCPTRCGFGQGLRRTGQSAFLRGAPRRFWAGAGGNS